MRHSSCVNLLSLMDRKHVTGNVDSSLEIVRKKRGEKERQKRRGKKRSERGKRRGKKKGEKERQQNLREQKHIRRKLQTHYRNNHRKGKSLSLLPSLTVQRKRTTPRHT